MVAVREPLADPALALAVRIAVDVGRIDEVDAVLPTGVEQLVGFLAVRFDGAVAFLAEAPRSETELRYFRARLPERRVLHGRRFSGEGQNEFGSGDHHARL